MNRRIFLSTMIPKVPLGPKPNINPRPTAIKTVEDMVLFSSSNGSMQLTKRFVDTHNCVTTIEDVEWKDPITNQILKKHAVDVYILESSDV